MRQPELVVIHLAPAAGDELVHLRFPVLAEVKAGYVFELGKLPADHHAESEGGDFTCAGERGEFVTGFERRFTLLEAFAVEAGIAPVASADAVHEGAGAGAQADVGAASPVGEVVAAGVCGQAVWVTGPAFAEVRDLVLRQPLFGAGFPQCFVHCAGEIFIDVDFLGLELMEEGGVFLVDDFVGGDVFALELEGFVQGGLPNLHALAGDGEHEIDIEVVESGLAQGVVGAEDHVAAVDAAQPVEELFVERLHAHGNAVDAALV